MLPMRDERTTKTEDRATQPMEAGGWVSQKEKLLKCSREPQPLLISCLIPLTLVHSQVPADIGGWKNAHRWSGWKSMLCPELNSKHWSVSLMLKWPQIENISGRDQSIEGLLKYESSKTWAKSMWSLVKMIISKITHLAASKASKGWVATTSDLSLLSSA